MEDEELKESINKIQSRLDLMAMPFEDALSHRVFNSAKNKVISFFAFATLLGILGYFFSVKNIEENITNKGTEEILKKNDAESIAKIKKNVEDKIIEQVLSDLLSPKGKINQRIEDELANVQRLIQKRIEQQQKLVLEQVGNKLNDKNFAEKSTKLIDEATQIQDKKIDAWSLYGLKKDKDNNAWITTKFEPKEIPKEGNKITASTDIYLRENSASFDKGNWTFPKIVSVIHKSDTVVIKEVKTIETPEGIFYWVRVEHKPS